MMSRPNGSAVSLQERLLDLIEANRAEPDGKLALDTPLIESGVLDSLGLFNLALFVESEVGRKIDITAFDLAEEWNTIGNVMIFIARMQASR